MKKITNPWIIISKPMLFMIIIVKLCITHIYINAKHPVVMKTHISVYIWFYDTCFTQFSSTPRITASVTLPGCSVTRNVTQTHPTTFMHTLWSISSNRTFYKHFVTFDYDLDKIMSTWFAMTASKWKVFLNIIENVWPIMIYTFMIVRHGPFIFKL